MKVSIDWLKQLVNLKVFREELVSLLPLRTIGLKEVTREFIELDMKGYNRADLLSLRGIAYEVAAITGSNILFSELQEAKSVWNETSLSQVRVDVLDSKLSPFYCIAKIEGIKVEKSSGDWVKKLETCGMRSVNNIADVTNLVMLEYGQPLHAFDTDKVEEQTIIVRTAKDGEELITLDGKLRKLSKNDLLITDPKKALGLAGVMGGQNSEVTENTSSILLEAAIFDPINLRQTATYLGLQSEACKRFQHGLTKIRLLQALNAAIQMYQGLSGKLTAISLVGNSEDEVRIVNLSLDKLNSLVGINFETQQVEKFLERLGFHLLGFHLRGVNANVWEVIPPYFRLDIEIEEDLIEEVARLYGYEKIPAKELPGEYTPKGDQKQFTLIRDLKNTLVNLGLTEIQTYSFYSTKVLNALGLNREAADKKLIKLANPMSLETEFLRESIWPNLLEVIDRNAKQGIKDIAIFEIGKKYYLNEKSEVSEKNALTIALTNSTDNPLSELEKIFKAVNERLDLTISEDFEKEKGANLELFHPSRLIQLINGQGRILGSLAEIHKRVTDKLGLNNRVAVLEISLIQQ